MNMFARFGENPAMTLQDIKETKRTDRRRDNLKTVYPPQTKFAGGYNDPQEKYCLGMFSKNILLKVLNQFHGTPNSPLVQMWIKT